MVRALMSYAARQPRIQRLDRRFTVDLAVVDGRCCGAIVLNEMTGERTVLPASAVVLSTGGAGQVRGAQAITPELLVLFEDREGFAFRRNGAGVHFPGHGTRVRRSGK